MCIFTTDKLLSKIHFLGLMKCTFHLCVPYIFVESLFPQAKIWILLREIILQHDMAWEICFHFGLKEGWN